MTDALPGDYSENSGEAEPAHDNTNAAESQTVQDRQTTEMWSLHTQGRKGANWFYWVAGLSMVNTAIILLGGSIYFIVGLGVTMAADILATLIAQDHPNAAWLVKGVALAFDIFVALMLAAIGWLSGRRYQAVFVVGMVLYLLDGLILLWGEEWLSGGFHAYVLVCMWSGFQAFRKLRALEVTIQDSGNNPPEAMPAT